MDRLDALRQHQSIASSILSRGLVDDSVLDGAGFEFTFSRPIPVATGTWPKILWSRCHGFSERIDRTLCVRGRSRWLWQISLELFRVSVLFGAFDHGNNRSLAHRQEAQVRLANDSS